MHHNWDLVAVDKETVKSISDAHLGKLTTVHQFTDGVEVVGHYRRIFRLRVAEVHVESEIM